MFFNSHKMVGWRKVAFWSVILSACLIVYFATILSTDGMKYTDIGWLKVETIASGLDRPWALAFLPDGRMLVTERPGRLRLVTQDGRASAPLKGVPEVFASGEGGLLDVTLDRNFASNRLIYLSYAAADESDESYDEPGERGASLVVARGKLGNGGLEDVQVLFRQEQKGIADRRHFGSRLAFGPDGKLFITIGERHHEDFAQDLSSHLGKILRIEPDGSIPEDNPFVRRTDAQPEIWSYGHRNPQGLAFHPVTGKLWVNDFGPLGGDELNIIGAGKNYGWPVVSWGRHNDGREIPAPPTHPEFADAIYHWTPVISPSGMTFYTADLIPGWRGNLLIAGLSSAAIVRLTLDGEKVTGEERIAMGSRIRAVTQGPDGAVYALTDMQNGRILRLSPAGWLGWLYN